MRVSRGGDARLWIGSLRRGGHREIDVGLGGWGLRRLVLGWGWTEEETRE